MAAGGVRAACPPEGGSFATLRSLAAKQWQIDDDAARDRLATDLVDCLSSTDPMLRDEIAFGGLQAWLCAGALTPARRREIGTALMAALRQPDADGFGAPFAALALSEVVRADRLRPLWTAAERQGVLDTATAWMKSVRDHRGFEPGAGWRHAVAHGADLLMQLALNPSLDKAQLDAILAAVASQMMPGSGHSYVHGEGERLARPLLFVARRGLHSEAEWTAWFARATAAAALPPGVPPQMESLARVHNLKGVLYPLYAAVMEGGDAEVRQRLRPGLVSALQALP
jgi:hypothetical protein